MADPALDAWLARLPASTAEAIGLLRALIRRAAPHLRESLKWNAPSYDHAGRHCVTLGVSPKGGTRLVLHRGAAKANAKATAFADPAALARWPSPDRGVIHFATAADIAARSDAIVDLVRRWAPASDGSGADGSEENGAAGED